MPKITMNVKINTSRMNQISKNISKALEVGVNDVIDDLVRTSSETAPHDKGILEKSHAKAVTVAKTKVEGTVEYSAIENGYNYAVRMHEDTTYNLGEKSLKKGGGTGMSGTHYEVGDHFLTRPLEGESETYKNHIANMVKTEINK
jgi:hypothetical protein